MDTPRLRAVSAAAAPLLDPEDDEDSFDRSSPVEPTSRVERPGPSEPIKSNEPAEPIRPN